MRRKVETAPAEPQPDPSVMEGRMVSLGARAHLAATYAGLLGQKVLGRDMTEEIARADERVGQGLEDVTLSVLARAFKARGMLATIQTVEGRPRRKEWPALAEMSGGQLVLVLSQSGGRVEIYDRTCPDNRAKVDVAEFCEVFTGRTLKAEASIEQIAKTHGAAPKPAHWFWGEFPRYRRFISEIAVGSFVANLLAVAVALFSLQVYDRVIPHQSYATLWVLALGAALAIMLEGALKLARSRLMDGGGRAIELSVQRLLMLKIVGMRSDKRAQSPSELFSTMREFSAVREFFTASTIGTLTDLPFILLFLALVATIAGNVVWVLVIGGVLMVLPGFLMQKRMMELSRETQGASVKSSRLLHEAIYELDTVKTTRGEDRVMRMWDELNTVSSVKSSEQRKLASILTFWSQGVQQATYVAAVVLGTFLVFAGEFTVGTIIATGILTGRTLAPLSQLAGTLARWSNVKNALDGLDQVVNSEQEIMEGRTYLRRDTLNGEFELQDVVFRYDEDGRPNLQVKGAKIGAGQSVAILGANGSGKSTLLKMLSGLYSPTQGKVLVDGVDISQIEPRDLRQNVGYLSQDVRLFAGTLRDNLNLHMLEGDDSRMMQALDFAGLGPFVKEHHKGLDLDIRDGGEGLSVGQRQSIGWARLWLQDPRVVLLDEPTAALDQALESAIVSRLEGWLKKRTAIIATHRLPILALTSRVMILQNGRLAVDGPREKVLEHLRQGKSAATTPSLEALAAGAK
ncbi:ATP-binding cassette domain-containing protein [Alphaproteobacteria bacterium KMM 3653]|uniref:ATP-binding cassette domain-containing protein n=1 Tax=Harenicola maris TaxID=2841044 RepID=A0AAP2CMT2_9RHOB|nr:ATP-binding cassette domain-containing protein [Harenicola maris]